MESEPLDIGDSGLLLFKVEYQMAESDVNDPLETCYVLASEVWEAAKLMQDHFSKGKMEGEPRRLVRRVEILYNGVYALPGFLEIVS